jgi:acetyltransferase-like isoleucine patch superfamily enzyme
VSVRDLAARVFGLPCFAIVRLGQEYSNRIQLSHCSEVGQGVRAGRDLSIINQGRIVLGNESSLGDRTTMVCYAGGSITLGRTVFLANDVLLASDTADIVIGDDCLIAEGVSIRASNHGTAPGVPIRSQRNVARDIVIGRDVWIGKGVTVLAGSRIADGCVIGANSVVRGTTEPQAFYAGVPIRRLKSREPSSTKQ